MQSNDRRRYLLIIVLSVLLNYGLSTLASALNLPLWLDTTGTAFAALALEPAAGLIVGLINNFYEAIFLYGASSLIFYAISAAMAIVVGVTLRKAGWSLRKRALVTLGLAVLLNVGLSIVLNLWQGGGNLVHPWEQNFRDIFAGLGLGRSLAAALGITLVKTFDVAVTLALAGGLYRLTPKRLRNPLSQ